jgi:hypothetical protein
MTMTGKAAIDHHRHAVDIAAQPLQALLRAGVS